MSWLTGRYLLSGSECVVFVEQPNDNQASSILLPWIIFRLHLLSLMLGYTPKPLDEVFTRDDC